MLKKSFAIIMVSLLLFCNAVTVFGAGEYTTVISVWDGENEDSKFDTTLTFGSALLGVGDVSLSVTSENTRPGSDTMYIMEFDPDNNYLTVDEPVNESGYYFNSIYRSFWVFESFLYSSGYESFLVPDAAEGFSFFLSDDWRNERPLTIKFASPDEDPYGDFEDFLRNLNAGYPPGADVKTIEDLAHYPFYVYSRQYDLVFQDTNKYSCPTILILPKGMIDDEAALNSFGLQISNFTPVSELESKSVNIDATAGAGGSATGSGNYNVSTPVTLKATANANYTFDGWYENDTKVEWADAEYTFIATADRTLEARFIEAAKTVTITTTAGTGGTVTGGGDYDEGASVTLKATANPNYSFDGWYENNKKVSGASATYTFTATDDRTLEARFTKVIKNVTINATAGTGGSVTGGGDYDEGDSVTLKATANSNYTFDGWYENNKKVSGAGATYTFTASANRTLQARFLRISSSSSSGGGSSGRGGGGGWGILAGADTQNDTAKTTAPVNNNDTAKETTTPNQPTNADTVKKPVTIKATIGSGTYSLNGESKAMDASPVIINGYTMVPLRFVAESLGAEVTWDGLTKTVGLNIDNKKISLKIGQLSTGMDVAPVIINGRTMVPLRYVSEQFGATVNWDENTKTITISTRF